MATRKAYAISDDGLSALMFPSKALRDLFVNSVSGFDKGSFTQYRKVERKNGDSLDQWGNVVRFSPYNTLDMSVLEYWEDDWCDVYEVAIAQGLI